MHFRSACNAGSVRSEVETETYVGVDRADDARLQEAKGSHQRETGDDAVVCIHARAKNDPSVIVFSDIKRFQLPHFTQFFQKAKNEQG